MALLAAALGLWLTGCQTYAVREVKHERLDEVSGARLELFVSKQSSLDDRPMDQKTLKVLTRGGSHIIFVETLAHGASSSKLQVNRDGRQHDADADDWTLYKQYMRNYEEADLKEGPANARQRE